MVFKIIYKIPWFQWGSVSTTAVKGYKTFTLPISSTIWSSVSMLKSNVNNDGQLGWHGIGKWSSTQINITWNTYENRSPVNLVGYILISK